MRKCPCSATGSTTSGPVQLHDAKACPRVLAVRRRIEAATEAVSQVAKAEWAARVELKALLEGDEAAAQVASAGFGLARTYAMNSLGRIE
jgi:hypothetical protein